MHLNTGLHSGRGRYSTFGPRIQSTNVSSNSRWSAGNLRGTHFRQGQRRNKNDHEGLLTAEAPTGPLVTELKIQDINNLDLPTSEANISNLEVLSSYSLVSPNTQKIIVPGEPALWTPPSLPIQLEPDQGEFLRDPNGACFPENPMLPTVQSIFAMKKSFEPASVNVVGCASSLGNLLRAAHSVEASFRFDVELIGDTLFIIRNAKDEKIPGVYGYGHSFLETFTTYADGFQKTTSHQRIVKYHFAGLDYVVRFESDGYISTTDRSEHKGQTFKEKQDVISDSATKSGIEIDFKGTITLQESNLEVKTRSRYRGNIDLSEHLPRLWVRQIPNLVTGYHERGIFSDVQKINVSSRVKNWEKENQIGLRKYAAIVNWLLEEVKRASQPALEVYRQGNGPLQLREHSGRQRQALPEEWRNKWAGFNLQQTSDEDSSDSDSEPGYPVVKSLRVPSGSDDDEDTAFDYTACDLDCGYCGQCA